MPNLIHLIYASCAARALAPQELGNILAASRRNNTRDDVTGMLLHSEGSFFQVLEGEADVVETVFARIDLDSRHVKTTCIIKEPIARRTFGEWTMGFAELSENEAKEIVGLNDFYRGGLCLETLNVGRARKLLQAFAAGRWHTQLRPDVPGAVNSRAREAVA